MVKIRGAMPNVESVLALFSKVSIDKENNLFKYPINNFKFEPKLKKMQEDNIIDCWPTHKTHFFQPYPFQFLEMFFELMKCCLIYIRNPIITNCKIHFIKMRRRK